MAQLNPRAILLAVALIQLSATTIAEEAKRCYWCGPLAEQVHRSQRAPPCSQELKETMCERGFTHCAVVATSPPYAESRLCVKLYQDECYSLYCNSSKTWRMICPCQGDLCNGRNTDREINAFSTLPKIVGKNKRTKRSMTSGFISPRNKVLSENQTIIVLHDVPDNETSQFAKSEQPDEELIEIIHSTPVMSETDDLHDKNDVGNVGENTIEHDGGPNEIQADQPMEELVESNESATTDDDSSIEETTFAERSETTKTIDDIKNSVTTAPIPEIKIDDEKLMPVSVPAEIAKVNAETTELPPVTLVKPTSIKIELSVVQIKNPNDNLPPPEALQQNDTPDKVSVPTTMRAIEINTNGKILETTTHSMKDMMKKNGDTQNTNSLFTIAVAIILHQMI